MTWQEMVEEYWDEAASVGLTLFVGLNAIYGWVPAEGVAVLITIAGTLGIRVLKGRDVAAKEKAELAQELAHTAHSRLNYAGLTHPTLPTELPKNGSAGT